MSQSIEVQMLNALELFHYSYQFKNHLFVIALEEGAELEELMTDLRVISGARIDVLILSQGGDGLQNLLKSWSNRGYIFRYFKPDMATNLSLELERQLEDCFKTDAIPVFELVVETATPTPKKQFDHYAITIAEKLGADKIFFISSQPGLLVEGKLVSHLTPQEATPLTTSSKSVNICSERLEIMIEHCYHTGLEAVILQGKAGNLFQEIFTHRGIGTLLSGDYPNLIRRGEIADVMNLFLMMKPHMQTKTILPMSEDNLAEEITNFYVYTVNNSIVAAARLIDFGESCELSKFCTMPRYQGRGRATQLAQKMIKSVKKRGKTAVFALSIEPKMWEFFLSLGFSEISRKELPQAWQNGYDFTRSSKGFILLF